MSTLERPGRTTPAVIIVGAIGFVTVVAFAILGWLGREQSEPFAPTAVTRHGADASDLPAAPTRTPMPAAEARVDPAPPAPSPACRSVPFETFRADLAARGFAPSPIEALDGSAEIRWLSATTPDDGNVFVFKMADGRCLRAFAGLSPCATFRSDAGSQPCESSSIDGTPADQRYAWRDGRLVVVWSRVGARGEVATELHFDQEWRPVPVEEYVEPH